MANTFGILTALVLAFATLVAFKNKKSLQGELDRIANQENRLKVQKEELKKLGQDIDQLDSETANFDAERQTKEAEIEQQNAKNAGVEAQIADKEAEAKEFETKADEAEEFLKEIGDVDDLIPELGRLKTSIAQLDDDLAIAQTAVSQLENKKTDDATTSQNLSSQLSQRNSGKSYFVSARVKSIYRNWGFVTLNAGDSSGVVAKSKLKVMRGDNELARLIVTAVEANTATANIIPSSIDPENDISIGDVIIPLEDEEPAAEAAVSSIN